MLWQFRAPYGHSSLKTSCAPALRARETTARSAPSVSSRPIAAWNSSLALAAPGIGPVRGRMRTSRFFRRRVPAVLFTAHSSGSSRSSAAASRLSW